MWEERSIVCYLMKYHSSADLNHNEKISAIKFGADRSLFFQYVQKEMYGHSSPEITESGWPEWKSIRYIVDECIEDGYLKEVTRNDLPALLLTSKGKKLARPEYFYLKYLPEEFGDFKVVLLTIVGVIITSPIWNPIIKYIGLAITHYIHI